MKETDCRKCCVCAFKEDLCNGDFCEKYYREGNTEDFEKLLPHWIPCSERLPEEAGTYLCTCANAERWMVTLIKWQPRMRSWNLTGARAYWKVVAWMSLPEPYKRGKQNEETD